MTRIVNDLVDREESTPRAREEIARLRIPPKGRSTSTFTGRETTA